MLKKISYLTRVDFIDLSWKVFEYKICWKLIHKQLTLTLDWFHDFELKCWGKLVDLDPGWFYDFRPSDFFALNMVNDLLIFLTWICLIAEGNFLKIVTFLMFGLNVMKLTMADEYVWFLDLILKFLSWVMLKRMS